MFITYFSWLTTRNTGDKEHGNISFTGRISIRN